MASSLVATSTPVEHVRVIAFNRPDKRNALSQALIDELLLGLSAANKDDSVHAIVITGNEKFFSGETPPNGSMLTYSTDKQTIKSRR